MYPRQQAWKRAAGAALVSAALAAAAGCGGGGGGGSTAASEAQDVRGAGFAYSAPADWQVTRAARSATARPGDGPSLASVTVLVLRSRYRPEFFSKVAGELDRVTDTLAAKLRGKVIARRSILVAGIKSRQYDVAYSRAGSSLIDRITYVLRGKSEYYLLCRWPGDGGESTGCDLLTSSFRIPR